MISISIGQRYLINYILPLEDIDELERYISRTQDIESLDILNISRKYDLENYIFSLFYKNTNKMNIFSKIIKDYNVNYNINEIPDFCMYGTVIPQLWYAEPNATVPSETLTCHSFLYSSGAN